MDIDQARDTASQLIGRTQQGLLENSTLTKTDEPKDPRLEQEVRVAVLNRRETMTMVMPLLNTESQEYW